MPSVEIRFRQVEPSPELERAARALATRLSRARQITVNDNRRRALSWRSEGGALRISVHRLLLPEGIEDIAAVIEGDPNGPRRVRARLAVAASAGARPRAPERSGPLVRVGIVHDLVPLFEHENAARFGGALDVPFGWGRWGRRSRRPQRSIRLGSFREAPPQIRIHPVLDCEEVPRWFVRFVLFHEMLHAEMRATTSASGRRLWHSRAFRDREAAHPDFDRATRWERDHISSLLRRASAGPR